MKLFSWNVNGLRAILNKDFYKIIATYDPDVLCLQEIKAQEEQVTLELAGYFVYWHSAEKKGYSGTLTASKQKPLAVLFGLGEHFDDTEGRVLTLEFDDYFLVNCYMPNAQPGLVRMGFKQEWNKAFMAFVKDLGLLKEVVICGDLNVAHKEIDLARPKENRGSPGFSDEERNDMTRLLSEGFVDVWRERNPCVEKYTWWSYRMGARGKNIGWRIDYFLASKNIAHRINESELHNEIIGSDHCPVSIDFK